MATSKTTYSEARGETSGCPIWDCRCWRGSGGTLAIRRYLLDVLEALPSFPEPVGFCRWRAGRHGPASTARPEPHPTWATSCPVPLENRSPGSTSTLSRS